MPNSVRLRNSCGAQGSQSKGGGTLVLGSLAKDPHSSCRGKGKPVVPSLPTSKHSHNRLHNKTRSPGLRVVPEAHPWWCSG